jgi:hypothetical protein
MKMAEDWAFASENASNLQNANRITIFKHRRSIRAKIGAAPNERRCYFSFVADAGSR